MGEKTKILFVDDQQEILDGLRRMTRSVRSEWEVNFALGGEAALEMMENKRFDIIVTDMRMPGMDGVELLKQTVARYPHMIRIVLSGQYDVDSFIKSGWPAHQFLPKPCDAETLKQTISHTVAMRGMLDDEHIRDLVSRADILPSLPSVYLEIEKELQSEHASMKKVGEIISCDVGLTAKVLQLVNSPMFGRSRKIESPTQAVVLLGTDMIKALVLYLQTSSTIKVPSGLSLERISSHSVRVGMLAREIAALEGEDHTVCYEAFLAGLLQNVGSLIVISNFPDEYQQIADASSQEDTSVYELEKKILGATHAEIGAYLISLWGLSPRIAEAVAYHENPSVCPVEKITFELTAIHVANALDKDPALGVAFVENDFDFEYLQKQGVLARLPDWQELHQKMMQE